MIDLAGSRQPLVSADGAIAVVFNGEIYNFRALRRELAGAGHVFATQGDGEVLVHGWKAWGRAAARPARRHVRVRAVGSRAARALPRARSPRRQAALLRVARRRARVRLGAEGAAPVSRAAARARPRRARALPRMPVHPRAAQRLSRRSASCRPGHWLSVRDGALATGEFWRPSYVPKHELRGSGRRRRSSTRELARSVESMLVADVPLGAFVSGGVDSGRRRRARHAHLRPRARHVQPRLHRPRRRQRARRGGARRAAHRQPPSLPDAGARRRAARARPLGRRVRRAVRRPGRAADDAARRIRAARGDRRADRRRRRRGVRRLLATT